MNDKLKQHYNSELFGGCTGNVQDCERRFIGASVSQAGKSTQDMWMSWFNTLGYTGSYNENMIRWWDEERGTFSQ